MIASHKDFTAQFNLGIAGTTGILQIDTSGYDYCIVHFVNLGGAITFTGSNDGGGITGETDGNATSAINWVSVQGVNQTTGAAGTTAASGTIYKFSSVSRYLKFAGTASTSCKILVYFAKISQTM
jgi:hypothetical protein